MKDHHWYTDPLLGGMIILLVGFMLVKSPYTMSFSNGTDWRNVSVDTRVNITNSLPTILDVQLTNPISLSPGGTQFITCNATIRDFNGGSSIANVSAVFYDNTSAGPQSADDNNNHLTNTSCTSVNVDGFFANYTCGFSLQYYANPGNNTWICNVTVSDTYNFTGNLSGNDSAYNTTTINELLALNVTPLINYGNLSVGDTSTVQTANITNIGNAGINLSVFGYGATQADGLAFVCDVGNISIDNQRFSLNSSGDFTLDYTSLSTIFQPVVGLTLPQQTNDAQQVINSTYWQLYVPPNPFGICNGTVVFQAEAAS